MMPNVDDIKRSAQAINEVANALREFVKGIEASVATTRGHYGDYMNFLLSFPQEQRKALTTALIVAGANEQGVIDALKLVS